MLSPQSISSTISYIKENQNEDGSILWFANDKVDPWNHIEAAMGLVVGAAYVEAKQAYRWLADNQNTDGSWYHQYPIDEQNTSKLYRDTNFCTYIAVGIWHYFLATDDRAFLKEFWPTVKKALDFAVLHQQPTGEILWAVDTTNTPCPNALMIGCCSIYKSLECGILHALALSHPTEAWVSARKELGRAIIDYINGYDGIWLNKKNFSMEWFYPVLTGVLVDRQASEHIDAQWDTFVVPNKGCKCVQEEPWVTTAETCELVISLVNIGKISAARQIFDWIGYMHHASGAWETGFQMDLDIFWPENEHPTWTSGAVLLAHDSLSQQSKTSTIFKATPL